MHLHCHSNLEKIIINYLKERAPASAVLPKLLIWIWSEYTWNDNSIENLWKWALKKKKVKVKQEVKVE